VPPRDPAALGEALGRLLERPSLRADLGARGIETSRRYAWPTIAERLEEIYGSLVGPGRVTVGAESQGESRALLRPAKA
jgi:glycosyltransferase involved in cell wall biosynthesis